MIDAISPIKRFVGLLQGEKEAVKRIYLYSIFYGLVALSLPLGIQAIIGFIQTGQITASWLVLVFIVFAGIILAGWLQVLQLKTSERIQQRIFAKSALELAYRIPKIKSEEMYSFYAPELANRFFDTITIQKGLSKILIDFTSAVMQIVFGLILLSFYHPFFILLALLVSFLLYIIVATTFQAGLETSIKESKHKYATAHWLEEIARSVFTFKLNGDSELHMSKTDKITEDYLWARKKHFGVLLKQFWGMIGFRAILALALLLIGGFLVINQSMNIGQFVAAEIIILLILSSVEKLILSAETIYDVLTAFDKLGVITDLDLEKDLDTSIPLDSQDQAIRLSVRNLSFTYPGGNKMILNNLSFTVPAGERLCITGKNASGKSTLLGIISTLYQPTEGVLKFNDFHRSDICLKELRTEMGALLDTEELFEGTLLENISLNRDAVALKDVMNAIKNVCLSSYVNSLPEGLQTMIKPTGASLPQGIIQKILLARSIASKPKLLLVSNNLNNLSLEDRNQIIDFVTDESNNWTLICSTSDAYIASKCNRLLVLSEGNIIHDGKFQELIKNSEVKNILYA